MSRFRRFTPVLRSAALATSLVHGVAVAAPTSTATGKTEARPGPASPPTTSAEKPSVPPVAGGVEATPPGSGAPSTPPGVLGKPHGNADDCATKTSLYQRVTCLSVKKSAATKPPVASSNVAAPAQSSEPPPEEVFNDIELTLAAEYVAPGELEKEARKLDGAAQDQNHSALVSAPVATALTAVRAALKDVVPELKDYAKRRMGHERRARIVAAIERSLCSAPDGTPKNLPLFEATCAIAHAFADSSQGGVASLAVLQRAARLDLARLDASVIAKKHPSLNTRLIPVVRALIAEILQGNEDASTLAPLAAALHAGEDARAACGLQMTWLAEDMSARFKVAAPVTSVVWAGLTVLPACASFTPTTQLPTLEALKANAKNDRYLRPALEPAAPMLRPLTMPAGKPADAPPRVDEANKGGESSGRAAPQSLRYLDARLRAAAALAERLHFVSEPDKPLPPAGEWLREFADALEITAAVAVDDYADAAARAAVRLNQLDRTDALRHVDLVVALASGEDEAKLERTLVDATGPAHTWRVKRREGRFNWTLSAMPGVMTAAEFRRGVYGTTVETFSSRHYQAPSLQLPIGFDFAWGVRGKLSLGLFVSMIDPLAFLQYDVQRQGRLPGPSVLTALAPGLGFRIGLGRSPLSLMPFVAFRPRFRAWEPSIAGPGAHTLQVGVALVFDLVLVNFKNRKWR